MEPNPAWLQYLPFCVTAGHSKYADFKRIMELLITAIATALTTAQLVIKQVDRIEVAVNRADARIVAIELSRAGRVGKLDGEIADLNRKDMDQEQRIRKLEQKR